MLGVKMVRDCYKITKLKSDRTKVPIQGYVTSVSLFLIVTTMLPPIPMAFIILYKIHVPMSKLSDAGVACTTHTMRYFSLFLVI